MKKTYITIADTPPYQPPRLRRGRRKLRRIPEGLGPWDPIDASGEFNGGYFIWCAAYVTTGVMMTTGQAHALAHDLGVNRSSGYTKGDKINEERLVLAITAMRLRGDL